MSGENIDDVKLIENMKNQIATNYVQLKSVSDLLVEKGLLTNEEIDARFDLIFEKESNKLHDFLETGILKD